MMLILSLLRYRTTAHALKPAISRRKLKVVCGLVYLVGLIITGINSIWSTFAAMLYKVKRRNFGLLESV